MQVKIYQYNGIPNVIFKTLGQGRFIQGEPRLKMDLLNPMLTIQKDLTGASINLDSENYIQIDNKFYFIMNYTETPTSYEIQLHLDVLYTYRNEIEGMAITLERSSDLRDCNPDLVDPLLPIDSVKHRHTMRSSVNPFDIINGSDGRVFGSYVLVTSQKGYYAGIRSDDNGE